MTTRATHTGGEWHVGSSGFDNDDGPPYCNIYAGSANEQLVIATVLAEDVPQEEAWANAQLVIAGPKLLEACRAALELLEQQQGQQTLEQYLGLSGGYYVARLLREAVAIVEDEA